MIVPTSRIEEFKAFALEKLADVQKYSNYKDGVRLKHITELYLKRDMMRFERKAYTRAMDELVAAGKVRRINMPDGARYKKTDALELLAEI